MSNQPSLIKHKKLASVLRVLATAGFWLSVVMMVVSFVGSIGLRFVPENTLNEFFLSSNGSMSVGLDIIYIEITKEMLKEATIAPVMTSLLIFVFFASILLAVVCRQLVKVLKNVQNGEPFAKENAKSISIMGVAMIISSVVLSNASSYFMSTMIHSFKLENIVANTSSPDTNLLLTGLLLLILGEIFKYGAYLQNEYDSTL